MESLSLSEEKAMRVLWRLKRGFIKEVLEELNDDLPYTTLASTIKKLEEKGYVEAQKIGNAKCYVPLIAERTYKRKFMQGFVGHYFKDSYKAMVNFFVEEKELSEEELEEILEMIKYRKDR